MVGVRPGKGGESGHPPTGGEGVGEHLRRAREAHRATLEEVSHELHIPLRQLVALEEDDYSVFSAELYARGAYTAYAKYLGIDTNMSSYAFLRSLSSVRERIPLTLHTPATFFERLLHPTTILGIGGLMLALIVGGYIAWQLESFWRLPDVTVESPLSSVTSSHTVTLEGRAQERSSLTINGENVLLGGDSRFSVPLVLHKGINPVRLEVKNSAGRTRTKQLFLLRT